MSDEQPKKQYANHVIPNSFQTPNIYVDLLLELLTDSELRILLFATRHILGWREKIKLRKGIISLQMFIGGYGSYPGCGLNKQTVIKTCKSLVEYGILEKDGVTRNGTRWHLVEDFDDIDVASLELRLANKKSKNKKRTEAMLKKLEAKRLKLLCDNTPPVLCDNTPPVLCDNTESNPSLNPPSNKKDLPAKNAGDEITYENCTATNCNGKCEIDDVNDNTQCDTCKTEYIVQRNCSMADHSNDRDCVDCEFKDDCKILGDGVYLHKAKTDKELSDAQWQDEQQVAAPNSDDNKTIVNINFDSTHNAYDDHIDGEQSISECKTLSSEQAAVLEDLPFTQISELCKKHDALIVAELYTNMLIGSNKGTNMFILADSGRAALEAYRNDGKGATIDDSPLTSDAIVAKPQPKSKKNAARSPEQKQNEINMWEAIKYTWKVDDNSTYLIIKLRQFFMGTVKKTGRYKAMFGAQLSDIPANALEVVAFGIWYGNEYPDITLPENGDKLRSHFDTFRGRAEDYNKFMRRSERVIRSKLPKIVMVGLNDVPVEVESEVPEEEMIQVSPEEMAKIMSGFGKGGVK